MIGAILTAIKPKFYTKTKRDKRSEKRLEIMVLCNNCGKRYHHVDYTKCQECLQNNRKKENQKG